MAVEGSAVSVLRALWVASESAGEILPLSSPNWRLMKKATITTTIAKAKSAIVAAGMLIAPSPSRRRRGARGGREEPLPPRPPGVVRGELEAGGVGSVLPQSGPEVEEVSSSPPPSLAELSAAPATAAGCVVAATPSP